MAVTTLADGASFVIRASTALYSQNSGVGRATPNSLGKRPRVSSNHHILAREVLSDSSSPNLLRLRGVTKAYSTPQGRTVALNGVDLTLDAGSTLALMGESGSGISTLLHLIAGLDDADAGEIWLDGVSMTARSEPERAALRRGTIGIVFQQFNLIPSLNVRDNIAFQARIAGRFDPAWRQELSGRLGLKTMMDRYPEQLSGGQQQRVAIARALAPRPRLLLADEPTGNLDETSGDEVLQLALELVMATGCAFLMATHSNRLAARLDEKVTLSSGVIEIS
jgi:putative ABC transport system ATP-binding protein